MTNMRCEPASYVRTQKITSSSILYRVSKNLFLRKKFKMQLNIWQLFKQIWTNRFRLEQKWYPIRPRIQKFFKVRRNRTPKIRIRDRATKLQAQENRGARDTGCRSQFRRIQRFSFWPEAGVGV